MFVRLQGNLISESKYSCVRSKFIVYCKLDRIYGQEFYENIFFSNKMTKYFLLMGF